MVTVWTRRRTEGAVVKDRGTRRVPDPVFGPSVGTDDGQGLVCGQDKGYIESSVEEY